MQPLATLVFGACWIPCLPDTGFVSNNHWYPACFVVAVTMSLLIEGYRFGFEVVTAYYKEYCCRLCCNAL
jgi:hypothetical protein